MSWNIEGALDTSVGPLIYSDQFIEFSIALNPSDIIYGIGERRGDLNAPRNHWEHSIWNRDVPPIKVTDFYKKIIIFS